MDEEQRYVTRSGLTAMLLFEGEQKSPHRDAWDRWYTAWTADETKERVCVRFLSPGLMDMHLHSLGRGGFEQNKANLGLLAVLDNFDGLAELPADPHGNRVIEIRSEDAAQLLDPPKQSDREIRRFLTRRIYDAFSRSTLTTPCAIRTLDALICGASLDDLLRNAQLLEEEGYLKIEATAPDGLAILPRAKLIREVERYGASREDAAEEADILAAIGAYAGIRRHEGAISLEYRRYAAARTAVELESVFRALAPIVEGSQGCSQRAWQYSAARVARACDC